MEIGTTRRSLLVGAAGAGIGTGLASSSAASSSRPNEAGDWETTLEAEEDLTINDVVVLEDGSLLAVGQEGILPQERARAIRLASDGTVEWSKRIPNDEGEREMFTAVTQAPDGGAVAVGYNYRPHDAFVAYAGWVVKLAQDGTVVRRSTLPHEGAMGFQDLVRDGDGFAVLGSPGLDAGFPAIVVWLDGDGRERDRRIVAGEERTPSMVAIAANDQGYCLVGSVEESGDEDPPDIVGYAIGLDRNASVRWRETYEVEHLMGLTDVVSDDADGFLMVGGHTNPETLVRMGHAISVDGDGSQRWHETDDEAARGGFDAVERTADGFVAVGSGPEDHDAQASDPRIVALDSSGDITARTQLSGSDRVRRPEAIAIPDPGRSVVVGTDFFEAGRRGGFALETATPSGTAGGDGGLLSAPMPGPGIGAALGGLAVGAGLLAARRRSRDD